MSENETYNSGLILFAWPAIYYLFSDWLNGYAYRIDLDALPFTLTSLIAIVIGSSMVAGHAFLAENHVAHMMKNKTNYKFHGQGQRNV